MLVRRSVTALAALVLLSTAACGSDGEGAGSGSGSAGGETLDGLTVSGDFGKKPTIADAMYAPVTTRFITYAVDVAPECADYCRTIAAWPPMQKWKAAALEEPEEMEELDAEF